jgi:catalase (peroxidase I)
MSNPDNAGLVMPINALEPLVQEYEPQGLSRTDMWMLSAVVASDVAETEDSLEFPFQWIGRKTCQELNNNNCGNNHEGNQASCTQFSGPNRELCHGTSGTTTILDFFEREFNFNAQQVAAIMGAHSLGAMRRVNLGFNSPSGWDMTNARLDNGYYFELLGTDDPIESAPDWTQVEQNNQNLQGIPNRMQWEVSVDETKLVMLNSDVALVREIDENINMQMDGRVDCTFKGPNACPTAPATMGHMIRYRNSGERFLTDFRDALQLMIDNGYSKGSNCPAGQVCQLQS